MQRSGSFSAAQDVPLQTERILAWIKLAMIAGIIILMLQSFTTDPTISGWRFFAIGALTALVATATGGALGLLFGLPITAKVVVVSPSTGASADRAQVQSQSGEWFSDNTSMEQIADWLTKIIVGLTLTQWESIQEQFNRVAAAVTAAMMAPLPRAGGAGAEPLQCIICPPAVSPALANPDAGMVAGGVILGSYAILGFLFIYLWARRYLGNELALARGSMIKTQRDHERQAVSAARQQGDMQLTPPKENPQRVFEQAARALKQATSEMEDSTSAFPLAPIQPGDQQDDPWKGQFGRLPNDNRAQLLAAVRPLKTFPGLFEVDFAIEALSDSQRKALVGQRVRLYLHPTFARSIRTLKFNAQGRIEVSLVCYGAFTIGAQFENGQTLELDLAELPEAPRQFREN